jgi:Zn-finger nucleic acid-binding protein
MNVRCPNDTTLMNALMLPDVHVEVCPACGGRWLEGEELRQIARTFAETFPN